MKKAVKNKKGQGLVEYLIIVAIIAVGSMAIIRAVGSNIDAQFATVANALGGKSTKADVQEVTENMYKKRDFGNFFEGAVSASGKGDARGKK